LVAGLRLRRACSAVPNTVSAIVKALPIGLAGWVFISSTALPEGIAVESTGRFAYAVNVSDRTVSEYIVQANGTLVSNGSLLLSSNAGLSDPSQIATALVEKSSCAYVVDEGLGTLDELAIDGSTGALSYLGSLPANNDAFGIAVHPSQKFIYVTAASANSIINDPTITVYTAGADPKLSPCVVAQTSYIKAPVGSGAFSIAVEPTGKFAYVANIGNGTIGEYSIDPTTGALTSLGDVTSETPANPSSDPFAAVTTH